MMMRMKWRRFMTTCITLCVLSFSTAAHAADDEEVPEHDGRTEGYSQKVQVTKASTSLVWLAFIALTVISMSVMFKDARRSHLD